MLTSGRTIVSFDLFRLDDKSVACHVSVTRQL